MSGKANPSETKGLPRGKTDWAALDAMTDEEAEAAALADPDCPPLDDAHPMARAKRIRITLKLSQQAFAERYHIPVSTLMDWERHAAQPDVVATAFLDAIASDPEGVAKALLRSSEKPEAAE